VYKPGKPTRQIMKRFLRAAILAVLSIVFSTANAQTRQQERALNRVFSERDEVYFTFEISDRSEIHELTRMISIDNVRGTQVWAYANATQFLQFMNAGYAYTVLTAPSLLQRVPTGLGDERSLTLSAYPTYTEYVALMQGFAADYPSLCRLQNIGSSTEGRGLYVLKITDNPDVREYEPQFLYTSTMHGDETTGYILMLYLIDHLLSNYGTDAEVTDMVNSMEIWINPLANPDGTYAAGNTNVNGATRENGNGVDLNRNYPDPQDGPHPDGNAYQPETMAWMAFADSMDFVMSANFHGGAEVFNYPWDTEATDNADRTWWVNKGNEYVDEVHTISGNNYMVDYSPGFDANGVTNGYTWYEVNGGRQDYMNTYEHCREVTIELSATKLIPPSQFQNHWNYNKQALLNYMKETYIGVHGIVTDACSGQGVKAKVFVNNHDVDSTHVYASLPLGNYYRPIAPGSYSVTFSAPGYESQTFTALNIAAGASLELMVQLQPSAPSAAFLADTGSSCGSAVQFTDASGSATQWLWTFGDGSTSTEQNPFHVYSTTGLYDVSLTVTNCAGTNTSSIPAFIDAQVVESPLVSATEFTSCTPQSFDLSASGNGDIRWFDAQTGGTMVASGSTFTTPVLSAPTTYYVENSVAGGTAQVGALDNTISGTGIYYTNTTYHYLVFDAYASFTLAQVKVYADAAGARTIDLRDAAGNVLQSASIDIPVGESYIDLNFNVPAGNGYQLGTAGGSHLYRNQGGAAFPYTLDGVLSITGNSAGAQAPTNYYYFYDWQIEQRCSSPRVAVQIDVYNGPLAVQVSGGNTYCEGDNIVFNATSNYGTATFSWTIDGAPAASGSSLVMNNAMPGNGTVICTANVADACGSPATAASTPLNYTVIASPTAPVITFTEPSTLSANAANVQWYYDGVAIAGATSPNIEATVPGTYTAVALNGWCESAASNGIEVVLAGVQEQVQGNCMIYPNPASQQFTLTGLANELSSITIMDATGRQVTTLQTTGERLVVNCSAWSVGLYVVRITTHDQVRTMRVEIK
jgi:PKD repeat protein